jgi:hypothetical protein
MKRKLRISFSGGATSGYMLRRLLDVKTAWDDYLICFSNTGLEDERTLEFVKKVGEAWGVSIHWLEADVKPVKGDGVAARRVDFDTASRNGEPFGDMIAKYGIPNMETGNRCTKYLKLRAMNAYAKECGWRPNEYHTAIGIRADEIDRISPNAGKERLIYPLACLGVTKDDVQLFWDAQSFKLETPEHFGNCRTCWKKSDRKLITVYREAPEAFDFMREMEAKYGSSDNFWRKDRTLAELLHDAKDIKSFVPNTSAQYPLLDEDITSGCDESCEVA